MAKECMSLARQKGINLFDNAEIYGNPAGAAEEIMGEAMAQLQKEDPKIWRRSEIIVSTKIFWGGVGVNERGLSRKHINEGLDASLERLQVDYVDLLFCHRPDPFTPTETVVRSMTDIVSSGRATAWGTSEWSAQQITEDDQSTLFVLNYYFKTFKLWVPKINAAMFSGTFVCLTKCL